MKLIHQQEDLHQALQDTRPEQMAVAFVGNVSGLPFKNLKEVVVSTSDSSSPEGLDALIEKVGRDNFYLLDGLHAKIYIGQEQALMGSPNFSSNGFLPGGLQEAAALTADPQNVRQLRQLFTHYRQQALEQYPDWASRERKLLEMQESHRQRNISRPSIFQGHELHRIHVCWGVNEAVPFDEKEKSHYEALHGISSLDDIAQLQLHQSDSHIQIGDWILYWEITADGKIAKEKTLWIHVGELNQTLIDRQEEDRLLVLEGGRDEGLAEPFALDPLMKKKLAQLLMTGTYRKLWPKEKGIWKAWEVRQLKDQLLTQLLA